MRSFAFNPFTGNFDLISEVSLAAVGSSPNANAASLSSAQVLTLQPADATHPGVLTSGAQAIGGAKTFSGIIFADAGIDRSTNGTLSIGTNSATSTVINIGNSTATVNIQGTTIFENTTTLEVADPTILLNKGGAAGSAANSGVTLEESGSVTGYAQTSADRNSWSLKAPNTAGIAVITPGASGIVLDQSSHNAVTLAAVGSVPNGNAASLSGQVLNLQPADGSNPGVVSTTTQTFAGNKTFSGTIAASNLSGTNTGDVTVTAVGAVPNANAVSLSGQALTLQPANGTNPGVLTAVAQTIGGAKTFSSTISASNLSGTNTGDVTLTAAGATPNSNGASLSGQALTLQPADGTNPGILTAGAQTIGGAKTFSGAITASNLSGTNSGDVTLAAVGATPNGNAASLSGQVLTIQPADGTNPGVLTAGAQTIGGAKTFSGAITASNLSGTNSGDITLTAVGSSPSANGASLSGQALTLQPANNTNPGVVTTAAQTFAGVKTFSSAPNFSSLTASLPLKLDGSNNVLAQAISLAGSEVTGTLTTGKGGTGLATIGSANQVLGVNAGASALEYKTITAGTNITVTQGVGSITIAATGGSAVTKQTVRLSNGNGYGSTNTTCRRFSTTIENVGSDITYADSATLGATFTINTSGVYGISYSDANNAGGTTDIGCTLNSVQLSTPLGSITNANILFIQEDGQYNVAGGSYYFTAGDVIRCQTNGSANDTSQYTRFTITRTG